MLRIDHLAIIAPSLAEGAAHVCKQLGIEMPAGGQHPQMGTHNLLLRLGDDLFLEVIAVDPGAERPGRPRWFGLDDAQAVRSAWEDERRLRGWVARTDDLDAVLARHGAVLGDPMPVSRGSRHWVFAVPPDGSLPADGVAPSVMDWGPQGNPAAAMPDHGARLGSFHIEHPDPDRVRDLYASLVIDGHPTVRQGPMLRYRALIETPAGIRTLT